MRCVALVLFPLALAMRRAREASPDGDRGGSEPAAKVSKKTEALDAREDSGPVTSQSGLASQDPSQGPSLVAGGLADDPEPVRASGPELPAPWNQARPHMPGARRTCSEAMKSLSQEEYDVGYWLQLYEKGFPGNDAGCERYGFPRLWDLSPSEVERLHGVPPEFDDMCRTVSYELQKTIGLQERYGISSDTSIPDAYWLIAIHRVDCGRFEGRFSWDEHEEDLLKPSVVLSFYRNGAYSRGILRVDDFEKRPWAEMSPEDINYYWGVPFNQEEIMRRFYEASDDFIQPWMASGIYVGNDRRITKGLVERMEATRRSQGREMEVEVIGETA